MSTTSVLRVVEPLDDPRPDIEADLEIPGDTEAEILMGRPSGGPRMVPVRGQGAWLEDAQRRSYLDFTSGSGVSNLGHGHPALLAALQRQAEAVWHVGNAYASPPALRLARLLVSLTFADRVFFSNSGAEANEAALRLARRHAHLRDGERRSRIVSCMQAVHGRTLFTATAGGQPRHTEGDGPLPGGITHVPYNDIDAAESAIGHDVCAVIVEPIQGAGGLVPADGRYLCALRRLCDLRGALLVFDEVQCGMSRTGHLFAYQGYGVVPDLLTTAKALGNGMPIGALLTRREIASAFVPGLHASSCGGNPLASAVAAEVVARVSAPGFLERVRVAASRLRQGLERLQGEHPDTFCQVRGGGLMVGLVLAARCRGRAAEFARVSEAQGLLCLTAGPDVVRLLPPLVITDGEIDEALRRLHRCADRFNAVRSVA